MSTRLQETTFRLLNEWAPRCIAVAFSGGGDSLVLTHLAGLWGRERGVPLYVLHVDHNLRATASQEAAVVAQWSAAHGLPCHVLKWGHDGIVSGIQKKARDARYGLLLDQAHALGCDLLLTAHHQDDNLETFWMRFVKGSGLKGLRSMQAMQVRRGLRVGRPFLEISQHLIRAYAEEKGLAAIVDDPSNRDSRFLRVRLRHEQLVRFTHEERAAMSGSLERLRLADQALDFYLSQLYEACVTLYPEGYLTLSLSELKRAPLEIRLRLYDVSIRSIFPKPYPVSWRSLRLLDQRLRDGCFSGMTLGGCIIKNKNDTLFIFREPQGAPLVFLEKDTPFLWDRRFFIDNINKEVVDSGVAIKIVGERGMVQLLSRLPSSLDGVPRDAMLALPALWKGTTLMGVPFDERSLVRVKFCPQEDF